MIDLDGVRLDAVTEADCVQIILEALEADRGGWMVTPNLDHFARLKRDEELRRLYSVADLCVADGMPLVWASRLQGTALPERVAGSNLVWSLSAGAARTGQSVFLLGGDPGAAERAAEALCEQNPTLSVAGILCPDVPDLGPDSIVDLSEIRTALETSGASIVYVALGSPKQERLIERLRDLMPGTWWIGVGISFSFVAGDIRRAPRWMQRSGLEWVHRLTQEPRRLARRYLIDGIPCAARLLAGSFSRRVRRRPDGDVEVLVERRARARRSIPPLAMPGRAMAGRARADAG